MSRDSLPTTLKARRLGLFSQDEAIALVRADSHVSRSEGLAPRSQVLIRAGDRQVVATLYQAGPDLLRGFEVGLSEAAWRHLGVEEGADLTVSHAPPLESLAAVRQRIFGQRLHDGDFRRIVGDVAAGRYTDAHLAAFIAACSALPLDTAEIVGLTKAMVESGQRLSWPFPMVVDKHSVGGLPGNRTTPIVVAICTALGLIMPKTSSRAITSPAGTADTMETLAPVDLSPDLVRKVVEAEGGCVVWGGGMNLSPADEVLVRVGRLLDMDAEGQMVASVLSKKIAAGSTHAVIDIPVGPTAKVRTTAAAAGLISNLTSVSRSFGLELRCLISDGLQPVGRGIGPALEAMDVLAVLQGAKDAPADLRQRALTLAGAVLELAGRAVVGRGEDEAAAVIDDGRALAKLHRICEAQGGFRTPQAAHLGRDLPAPHGGVLVHVNNRKLAKLAKLAGAPDAKPAGVRLHARLGDALTPGQPILTVFAEAPGELEYAFDYARANPDIFGIET